MSDNAFLAICLCAAASFGCTDVVEHDDVKSVLAEPSASPIAKVNGRVIGAEELRIEMQRTGAPAPQAARVLVDRELLVERALEQGSGSDLLPVKSAMVRALLEDEIAKKVGPEQAPAEHVEALEDGVRKELTRPEGFRVAAMSIYVPKEVDGEPPDEDELSRWLDIAAKEAARIRDWMREEPTAQRMKSFDAKTIAKPLGVSVRADIIVTDPAQLAEATHPGDWAPNGPLASAASRLEDGEVGVVNVGPAFFVVARLAKIERVDPTDAEVRAEAVERVVVAVRREKLEEWLEDLRASHDVDLYPEVLAESAHGAELTSPE